MKDPADIDGDGEFDALGIPNYFERSLAFLRKEMSTGNFELRIISEIDLLDLLH